MKNSHSSEGTSSQSTKLASLSRGIAFAGRNSRVLYRLKIIKMASVIYWLTVALSTVQSRPRYLLQSCDS